MDIEIARGRFLSTEDEYDMYRLRYRVFRERLKWQVDTVGQLEVDQFDLCDPVYVIAKEAQQLQGCWRLLPTTGPYMLKDTFPDLLHGLSAPCDDATWELSRFAVRRGSAGPFGFGDTPMAMMQETLTYAQAHGIQRYVTVTTPALERLLKHLNIRFERFGPALQMGIERAVALSFDTNQRIDAALRKAGEYLAPCAQSSGAARDLACA
ncbi:acyl-homoserine-lactone synthase [Janthinobacterium fluminis]|uniref:Acyl-homoserine-lactone synthase n=1 Tax=Janthinobacterium fluminis TaxID=2987524 RepID=A0ABT5K1S4_9BURK|nr:acyl-homoserine-lactone synthase [Janthinobacterium fluminis]MDC8758934.1 acyl-homoserine-lactone synthase [Janthinobacterium fluminis]